MTRDERLALMWQLRRQNLELYADMAARRERAMLEDDPPIVKKTVASNFDVEDAIAEQEYQHRTRDSQQREQQGSVAAPDAERWAGWNAWGNALVSAHLEIFGDAMADILGEATGTIERKLTLRINSLEAELKLLRAMIDGDVVNIGGKGGRTNVA